MQLWFEMRVYLPIDFMKQQEETGKLKEQRDNGGAYGLSDRAAD